LNAQFWKSLEVQAKPWVETELRRQGWTLVESGWPRWVAHKDDARFDFTLQGLGASELLEQVEDFEALEPRQQAELMEPFRRPGNGGSRRAG
jgi:hypothetical protein